MLTKNPAEEIPVNIKNFLRAPFTFSLIVKNINTTPNKKKIINGNKKRKDPLNNSLTGGIKNSPIITRKTPTNAQNVNIRYFFIKFILPKNCLRRKADWRLTMKLQHQLDSLKKIAIMNVRLISRVIEKFQISTAT